MRWGPFEQEGVGVIGREGAEFCVREIGQPFDGGIEVVANAAASRPERNGTPHLNGNVAGKHIVDFRRQPGLRA